jgi:hypothetical protein
LDLLDLRTIVRMYLFVLLPPLGGTLKAAAVRGGVFVG